MQGSDADVGEQGGRGLDEPHGPDHGVQERLGELPCCGPPIPKDHDLARGAVAAGDGLERDQFGGPHQVRAQVPGIGQVDDLSGPAASHAAQRPR